MDTSASLIIANPKTATERSNRDTLLAKSLRDDSLAWPYASEYPLVLSGAGDQTSWCVYEGNNIIAHANLWGRKLTRRSDQKTIQVGFVGNVATHPKHRGQGVMSTLMSHLEKTAQSQNLQTLVLWSDLLEFYQTLGFTSIGRELRFRFLPDDRGRLTGISSEDYRGLSNQDLEVMETLRPKMEWNLERSSDEFRALLSIPDTSLSVRRKGSKIESWMLLGKGADMRGVIHEWGAPSAGEFIHDIRSIMQTNYKAELTLLTPGNLPHHWLSPIKLHSTSHSEHPMALAKGIGPGGTEATNALARGFIWGLDSI